MSVFGFRALPLYLVVVVSAAGVRAQSQAPSSSSSSSHSSQKTQMARPPGYSLGNGSVSNGVYRNTALGLVCKIPAGWVLRTDEMNAQDDDSAEDGDAKPDAKSGRVLLAAFSRPPEARAEDVNSSIVIAAESAATYPGLKDAAQYFGPLTQVAKVQGFSVVEEPYEFVVAAKTVPRSDFQKDVGSRVMRQSTLALLARGWAVSITFIGGTEDEVEELIEGLSFVAPRPK